MIGEEEGMGVMTGRMTTGGVALVIEVGVEVGGEVTMIDIRQVLLGGEEEVVTATTTVVTKGVEVVVAEATEHAAVADTIGDVSTYACQQSHVTAIL